MDLKDRVRKIDLNSLPVEQVDVLSEQIGKKVYAITDEAAARVNAILGIYGITCKIAIKFDKLPKSAQKKAKTPKKSSKSNAQDNL